MAAFSSAAAGFRPPGPAKGIAFPRGGPATLPRAPVQKGIPFPTVHKGIPFPAGQLTTLPRTPTAPPAPAAGDTAAPSPPAAAPGSALDSTYYANVAANQGKINSQIAGLNQQQGFDQTALQGQLAQLQHQEPLDQLKVEQGANSRGALYSTPYAQQQGQLQYSYLGRQGAAQDNYARAAAAIASKIAGLNAGEPLYEAQQAADATTRAANLAAKNPGVGEPAGDSTAAPSQTPLAAAIAASNNRPVVNIKPKVGTSKLAAVLANKPRAFRSAAAGFKGKVG